MKSPKTVRLAFAAGGAALIGALGFALPAAAHVAVQPAVSPFYVSAGRIGATSAALLGFIGIGIGILGRIRPQGRFGASRGRLGAILPLAAGLASMAIGGLVAITSDAGIGTGNGRAGSYVAMIVGLISVVLGSVAMARARRTE